MSRWKVFFSAAGLIREEEKSNEGNSSFYPTEQVHFPELDTSLSDCNQVLYNWLIWRVLKLACFFFQKSIFPVFILASGAVRTTLSLCRHIFM